MTAYGKGAIFTLMRKNNVKKTRRQPGFLFFKEERSKVRSLLDAKLLNCSTESLYTTIAG